MLLCGAAQVWTMPSLVDVLPSSPRPANAKASIYLYAARGEEESFQVCVRAEKEPAQIQDLRALALDEEIGPPRVAVVGYLTPGRTSPRGASITQTWPDPLLPLQPVHVAPERTIAFWITYRVPESASPGVHAGQVDLFLERGRRIPVAVTIQVFDTTLTRPPTLRSLFPLDRASVRRVYGIDEQDLEAWKPYYDLMGEERIAAALWDGGGLLPVDASGKADTTAFKQHLEYALQECGMSVAALAPLGKKELPFPAPPEGELQDPLQLYMLDMDQWLREHNWFDRVCMPVMAIPPREAWQEARNAFFRVQRADRQVPRLMASRPHPYLERYTDILAVSLSRAHPIAIERLRKGISLKAVPAYPLQEITASSSGPPPGEDTFTSLPEDAYDGCLFTCWYSAESPRPRAPQRLELSLAEPVKTRVIRIGWKTGLEPSVIETATAYDGTVFSPAQVDWEFHPAPSPFDNSWAEGRFRMEKTFSAIRFTFRETTHGRPVAVSEIEFDKPPSPETLAEIRPLDLWLDVDGLAVPSLAVDVHPVEARLLGWIAWGYDMSGVLGRGLNTWPESWGRPENPPPYEWRDPSGGLGYLMYPGPDGPLPSIRLERLRDGIEDHACLVALDRAVQQGLVRDDASKKLCARQPFRPGMAVADLETLATALPDLHKRIGLALDRAAREARKQDARSDRQQRSKSAKE